MNIDIAVDIEGKVMIIVESVITTMNIDNLITMAIGTNVGGSKNDRKMDRELRCQNELLP
jgi:hypothetical protein